MTIALACCAGLAAIAGWSLATAPASGQPVELAMAAAADQPLELAMRQPETGLSTVESAPEDPSSAIGKRRSRARCAGCAVVESVRRIDTFHALKVSCAVGDSTGYRDGDNDLIHTGGAGVESLAVAVASVIAGDRGRRKMAVRTRHQIVLRFSNGSKQVLDEATARNLNVGEQIMVIAGTDAKAFAGIQTASNIDQ